ncbi:hypothetical protein [Planomicrobium sp. CPCC 101110]|uniref:hypothetical protein n=1 Tax=Planomicrobium sp. CPCC 101110 TaxID=2599619 RepID=UPI001645F954|nr:hypothetical protein [Planomicrobium sp. CPCC 101110]
MEKERAQEKVGPGEESDEKEIRSHLDKIYSNIASNRYENLRTSHIENKAKELRKKKR